MIELNYDNNLKRKFLIIGVVFSIALVSTSVLFPNVYAKPFADNNTGISIHCKVKHGLSSCDITDRKNGINQVLLTNNEKLDFPIDGLCAKRISTPAYDLLLNQGNWNITVTNCIGQTSSFVLKLEGAKFTLLE